VDESLKVRGGALEVLLERTSLVIVPERGHAAGLPGVDRGRMTLAVVLVSSTDEELELKLPKLPCVRAHVPVPLSVRAGVSSPLSVISS
jgi:hypothetical protein